jgi:SHS2 domain-containing protein
MPYQYLNHTADLGIRGIGDTREDAFVQGALAMLAAIADLGKIQSRLACQVACTAPDIPALFVEWLNELLYQADVHGALWKSAQVTCLERNQEGWRLEGVAHGEPLDPDRHELYSAVKAATYAGLSYRHEKGKHILECVLDL